MIVRIELLLNNQSIGHIDYNVINVPQMMGELVSMEVQPPQLTSVLKRKFTQNEDVSVSGGFTPEDITPYYDGVIGVLLNMSKEIKGFDFQVPPEKDPLLRPTPESEKKAIH